ncbi:cytochrome c1 [Pseudoroseicyclus tamaricis]|uniref:Cytochrome c1 n=1 Tax=Pseudoroseicyclus tamaricis TaxID=2705421 RepID=A0A6B2K192_9RHOB|nr:cytochrome c1 [Pseudoroseicyclus tamaricis]NDV02719.1 cytochrome c1 [Pseudoroseicyclus tamaricis]
MLKTLALTAAVALGALAPVAASAQHAETHIENFSFSYEGPFGTFDQNQLQRGLQIYTEICAACHGMEYVAYRTLAEEGGPGLPEDQMRAYAQQFEVFDESLADGQGDYRTATPADYFPESSLSNAPDLSLMGKARAGFHGPYGTGLNQLFNGMGGGEYIASLLVGYEEPPECAPEDFEGYYNTAFDAGGYPASCIDEDGHHMAPGSWIAMPQPLYGEDIVFNDGHSNELHEEAKDVAAFIMWASEPHMAARKQAGFAGVIGLSVLAVLLYLTNKRLWAPHKHHKRRDED